jgi:Sec-independent protein translocase protein TatA
MIHAEDMSNPLIIGATFGSGQIVLILFLGLVLLVSRRFSDLLRGLKQGFLEFRKAANEVIGDLDREAFDAGRSVGGIRGKPAAEAITPDNKVAELYEPSAFEKCKRDKPVKFHFRNAFKNIFLLVKRFFSRLWSGRNRRTN